MFTANPIAFSTAFMTGFGISACARATENLIAFYGFVYEKPSSNSYSY
jgi:hypothetical protein